MTRRPSRVQPRDFTCARRPTPRLDGRIAAAYAPDVVAASQRLLPRDFFAGPTLQVARELVGCTLFSHVGGLTTAGRIVECEAYPPFDTTAHCYRGATPRCASMFAAPGTLYVYFTYGMHHCVNLTCEPIGIGAAILVRALEPLEGLQHMRTRRGARVTDRDLCRGPARMCVALGIDRRLDGLDTLARDASVFVARGVRSKRVDVVTTARIGVVGSTRDVFAARRFVLRDSPFASSGPAGRVDAARAQRALRPPTAGG